MTALTSESNRAKGFGKVSAAAVILVLFLLLVWLRVFYGSMQDYKTGETLLEQNQTIRAITYFDRALHFYAPLNPYLDKSAQRLWEIGEKAEKEGDRRMARIAFESIRNASYGTSSLFTPGREWMGRVDAKIKTLGGEKAAGSGGQGETGSPEKSSHPKVGWSIAVVVGFLGWVGSVFGFVVSVFRKGEEPRIFHRGLAWLCLIVVFAALWVAGMVMA